MIMTTVYDWFAKIGRAAEKCKSIQAIRRKKMFCRNTRRSYHHGVGKRCGKLCEEKGKQDEGTARGPRDNILLQTEDTKTHFFFLFLPPLFPHSEQLAFHRCFPQRQKGGDMHKMPMEWRISGCFQEIISRCLKKIRWEKPWITWGKSVPFVGITIAQEKSVFFIHAIHSTSSSSTIFLLYKKDMDMIWWGKGRS